MPKFRISNRSVPLLLVIVTILSYGLLIPRLGFYWDDWVFAFLSHFYGPAELIRAFAAYRPILGPSFFLTTTLFNHNPLLWQVFGLLLRFMTAFACWWSLSQVWPKNKNQVLATTLIFLVYPGYSQQWVALTHTNQEVIPLIAYLFSIGLTAHTIRFPSTKRWSLPLSIILQFIGLFSTEYFIGYELVRLAVIVILNEPSSIRPRLRNALTTWLPHAVVLLANALWLFSYYRSGLYQSYSMTGLKVFSGSFLNGVTQILTEAAQSVITASLYAWNQVFNLFRLPTISNIFLTGVIVLVLGFLIVGGFKLLADFTHESEDDNRWTYQAILLGLIGILVGRLPSWVAGLPFLVKYDYDRFFLSIMLGASLLIVGVVELIVKSGKIKVVFTSLLVALAICTQFLYAKNYENDTIAQKTFLSQFMWRAPSFQPGTILLTDKITAIPFESDMGLSAALNWMYTPQLASHDLPIILLYSDIRLRSGQLPSFDRGQDIRIDFRTARFTGNTDNTIVFFYPEVGCIKLVNPGDQVENALFNIPPNLISAAQLSNLDRIVTGSNSVVWPTDVLGPQIKPTWCYYFQKAELARQNQDWNGVNQLAQQAIKAGFRPKDPAEWLGFVEASIRVNDLETAGKLFTRYSDHRASTKDVACRFFQLMDDPSLSSAQIQFIAGMQSKFSCPP